MTKSLASRMARGKLSMPFQYETRLLHRGGAVISVVVSLNAMPGTREEVIAETRLRISQLAHGGGYILAPSNHLQADVPAENVVTLFETARQYGSYPIQNLAE